MRSPFVRLLPLGLGLFWVLAVALAALAHDSTTQAGTFTIPRNAPVLHNASFECDTGYYSQTNALGETINVPNDLEVGDHQGISHGKQRTPLIERWV